MWSVGRRQRVLVVSHTAERGGAEIALLRLIDAIDRGTFEIAACVFARGPLERELAARNVRVFRIGGEGVGERTREDARSIGILLRAAPGFQRLVRRLHDVVRRAGADLIIANSLKAAIVVTIVAPAARRPWVWHLHDRLSPDYLPRILVVGLRLAARLGARRVVVNSQATAATVRGARVVVAYPGIVVSRFAAGPASVKPDAIGMIGRISETKGQREFLDAVERLTAEGRRERYRIVGTALFQDGAFEADLRRRVATVPELRAVEWAGWRDDVATELATLKLFVHASPVPEPFGQVVVEAMVAGVPIIATHAGGIPEILAPDGEFTPIGPGVDRAPFGLLARPADPDALAYAIGWALDHPDRMREGAARASRDARSRFTIEKTAQAVQLAWCEALRTTRMRKSHNSLIP